MKSSNYNQSLNSTQLKYYGLGVVWTPESVPKAKSLSNISMKARHAIVLTHH